MAKKSDNRIPPGRMDIDWGMDPSNGLPYSGQSVQAFIKQEINSRAGAGFFDQTKMTLYLFATEDDMEAYQDDTTKINLIVASIPITFDTQQFRIRVTPDRDTTMNVSIREDQIILGMDVAVDTRQIGESWSPINDDVHVRVYVDANTTGTYTEIPGLAQDIKSTEGRLEIDVKPYLPIGKSRVRLYFNDKEDDSITSSIVWNINLAEMYIEEYGIDGSENTWYNAIVETGLAANYKLGAFKVVGNIPKTVHFAISTAYSVVAYFEDYISTEEYIDRRYNFTKNDGFDLTNPKSMDGRDLPALQTGSYNVKVWLTSGDLSTEETAVVYNIMYVAPGDENAVLVVMNNYGNEVNNYDQSAHLCDYAIYNGGASYANPTITITPYIGSRAEDPYNESIRVTTGELHNLIHGISMNVYGDDLSITYRVAMSNAIFQEHSSRINNKDIFPAEGGETFYLNPGLRSNSEAETREVLYNVANNDKVAVDNIEWTKMSWVDGIDGWMKDDSNNPCLFLPARTRLTIPASSYMFMPGEDSTIEFCYKVSNVSDYDENIITIAENPTREDFHGIRIKPTNITVHSGSVNTSDKNIHLGTNVCDEEIIHLIITIQAGYDVNKNLVTGYVNGCKNFQFEYDTGDRWAFPNSSAVFGSDTADLYLYMVRAYANKSFSASSAETNWISTLSNSDDKIAYKNLFRSITGTGTRDVSYETIKNEGKYNFFVVERSDGGRTIPTKTYSEPGLVDLEMHYGVDKNGNPRYDWDWKIHGVKVEGQGTTSMNYWLWNLRWRIDKTLKNTDELPVSYYDAPVISGGVRTFVERTANNSKTVWFDGVENHPAVKRITAKINFASSMQSHKMGATMAYNLLHDNIFNGDLLNEAQVIASTQDKPIPTVAVYEYPAFGFQRITDSLGRDTYKFIGLFTIGPDKGDKPTFGYNLISKSDLITLEGTDHDPQLTLFKIPWDEQTACVLNEKEDCFLATKTGENEYLSRALEVSNAGTADTKITSDVLEVLVDKFKPAYDVIYNNSTLIFPIALNDETWGGATPADVLENINNNISGFTGTRYSENPRFTYSDLEFWIEGEYHLYHFELQGNKYVSGKKENGEYNNPLDLRIDTGITPDQNLTLEEQNELFKEARRQRFIAEAPEFWDMNEVIFNYVYLLIFGATDNFAKNQYPQYMGGKWRFRQDDLDTIMDIDNNGGQTKPSYIEFDDAPGGSPYFGGAASVLWNLVHESLWDDFVSNGDTYPGIMSVGKEVLRTMTSLSYGDNTYDGFIKFFDLCFWQNAQEYFPQPAYNIDANIKYEAAWIGDHEFTVPPLQQSLGNHYSAEMLWVKRRALYCLSLFSAGAFGDSSRSELGRIGFRPVGTNNFNFTVAQPMYPCVFVGTNRRSLPRTMIGEVQPISIDTGGQGQTTVILQATDNLTGIGDLSKLQLSYQDSGNLSISGKRIRTIKIGDIDPNEVTTNVQNLNIANGAPSLEIVDLQNAPLMQGTLDLSECKRIKEVYANGTNVSAVILPRGSKIEVLHLGEGTTSISYQVVKYLRDLRLPLQAGNISTVYLEECNALDGIATISQIYEEDENALSFIRLLWDNEFTSTGKQIRMLANIEQNLKKDGITSHEYHGLTRDGRTDSLMNPVIEGKLIASSYYQSDLDILAGGNLPIESSLHPGLQQIQASYFGPLYISYSPENRYIDFVDSDVINSLYIGNVGDGFGVTMAQAADATSLGAGFTANDDISSFDELQYFTSLVSLPAGSNNSSGTFSGCTNLSSITIPGNITTIGAYSFYNCTSLSELTLLHDGSTTLFVGANAFINAPITRVNIDSIYAWMRTSWASDGTINTNHSLYIDNQEVTSLVLPSNLTSVPARCFYRCNHITSLSIPDSYTSIGASAFYNCTALSGDLVLPSSITSIGSDAFIGCNALNSLTIPSSMRNVYLTTIGGNMLTNGTIIVGGNLRHEGNSGSTIRAKNVIIEGNLIAIRDSAVFSGNVKSVRIYGDCTLTSSTGLVYAGSGENSAMSFFEVNGKVTGNGRFFFNPTSSTSMVQDCVVHLGYDGDDAVAALPSHIFKDSVGNIDPGRISTVYVGSGKSREADERVLEAYRNDPAWANYINKLDIWSNYSN